MKLSEKPIFIAADHAGYDLKVFLLNAMSDSYLQDLGTHSKDSVDYPVFVKSLALSMQAQPSWGILLCNSGIGMSIMANRYPHIRAALCHTIEDVHSSRENNNANVLVLGAKYVSPEQSQKMVLEFINTSFSTAERHQRRVQQLSDADFINFS